MEEIKLMSLKKTTKWEIVCDSCGDALPIPSIDNVSAKLVFDTQLEALDMASQWDWYQILNKDYCHNCHIPTGESIVVESNE